MKEHVQLITNKGPIGIPAFADKSEGPHTQKTQNFHQNFDPKNVKKQFKSSYLRPI